MFSLFTFWCCILSIIKGVKSFKRVILHYITKHNLLLTFLSLILKKVLITWLCSKFPGFKVLNCYWFEDIELFHLLSTEYLLLYWLEIYFYTRFSFLNLNITTNNIMFNNFKVFFSTNFFFEYEDLYCFILETASRVCSKTNWKKIKYIFYVNFLLEFLW